MNVLIDGFPESLTVGGKEFPIYSDFHICLAIMEAFEDNELTEDEKIEVMLRCLYGLIPEPTEEAINQAIWFLDCDSATNNTNTEDVLASERLYSFRKDARYIFSAFKTSHDIDLSKVEDLHWWKFVYLFLDLDDNTFFSRLVDLRRKVQSGKASKEEKECYYSIYEVARLDDISVFSDDEAFDDDGIEEFFALQAQAEQKAKASS